MGTGSHQTSVEIDRQTITELLEELNDKLAEHDVSGEMYIVGGAAMVLAYEASRSTSDIDCVISNGSDTIHQAAAEIAEKYPGLGTDWLNETAATAHHIPEDPDEESRTSYQGSHLTVRTASPERMLAMKVHANRTSDHEDIEQLLRFTRIKSGEEAKRITEYYFPHSEVPAATVNVIDNAIAKKSTRPHQPGDDKEAAPGGETTSPGNKGKSRSVELTSDAPPKGAQDAPTVGQPKLRPIKPGGYADAPPPPPRPTGATTPERATTRLTRRPKSGPADR